MIYDCPNSRGFKALGQWGMGEGDGGRSLGRMSGHESGGTGIPSSAPFR